MRVIRKIFVMLCLGCMMSCSNDPVDKALDQYEEVVEKIEKATSSEDIIKMEEECLDALTVYINALDSEARNGKSIEDLEKYREREKKLRERVKAVTDKFDE